MIKKFESETATRVLAKGIYAANNDMNSGLNNNDMIIGGSGTGKTGGYVIPNLKRADGSFVVADTKNQLCKLFQGELRQRGYDVKVLDFVHPERSITYNPLAYIRREKPTLQSPCGWNNKDITTLAYTLTPTSHSADPYWDSSARVVLTFLIAFTLEAMVPEEWNLKTTVDLLTLLDDKEGRKKLEAWCMSNPESIAGRQYRKFRGIISVERTWSCIVNVLNTHLSLFEGAEISHIFGKTDESLDFTALGHKKTAVFLNVSDTDRSLDKLVNVFYTQILQKLCIHADENPQGRLPVPVRIILDDFASNVYIADFDKIISIIRSRNISVSVILQSMTQLESLYPDGRANTIINNCDHLLYLGGQDVRTAEYVGVRCSKTSETVLTMPFDKAYVMERGRIGQLADKTVPYEDLPEAVTYEEVEDMDREDVFFTK